MKNTRFKAIAAAVLILAFLSGCGRVSDGIRGEKAVEPAYMNSYTDSSAAKGYAPQSAASYSDYGEESWMSAAEAAYDEYSGGMSNTPAGDSDRADTYDKIIYSGSANVETIHFDETIERIYEMIERYQGFLESAYVTGRDYNSQYYDRYSYRNAQFVIRVPREGFSAMRGDLDMLGSVTYSSVEAQNITSAYRDTESRLKAYRVEESRLLDMLDKADNVEDMLNIEDRLSNVRYQIESLTTTLTNWDSKVNYSTLHLTVQEVKELTVEKPIARTFGEDLRDGVQSSLEWLGQAGKNILIFIVSALPMLVIPAVLVVIVILVIRSRRRKKRKNTALHQSNDVKVDN